MMDEFFEITRYNLGSIPVEREQVDAVMLAEQVADELLPAASGRGVSIAVHAPDRPADSFIDLYKMARVLGNILKNAVALRTLQQRFCLMYASRANRLCLRSRIRDGKSLRNTSSIYSRSSTASMGLARLVTGAPGLALPFQRRSSQRMGGDITVMSESGNTVFIIRIPCSSSANK